MSEEALLILLEWERGVERRLAERRQREQVGEAFDGVEQRTVDRRAPLVVESDPQRRTAA